jgi:hypothetical protein
VATKLITKANMITEKETAYNIRQDVFGYLAKAPKDATALFWGILLRVMTDGQGPIQLPKKMWADARKLVEAGIAREPEQGCFEVNPEVVFLSQEPTLAAAHKAKI